MDDLNLSQEFEAQEQFEDTQQQQKANEQEEEEPQLSEEAQEESERHARAKFERMVAELDEGADQSELAKVIAAMAKQVLYYSETTGGVTLQDLRLGTLRKKLPDVFKSRMGRKLLRTADNPLLDYKEPPKPENFKMMMLTAKIRAEAKLKNINLFKPPPVPVPMEQQIQLPVYANGKEEKLVLTIETFDLGSGQYNDTPTFAPKYSVARPDTELVLFISAVEGVFRREGRFDAADGAKTLLEELKDTNNEWYYGNGSLQGQLARHQKVMVVYRNVIGARTRLPKWSKRKTALFRERLDRAFPEPDKPDYVVYDYGIPSIDLFKVLENAQGQEYPMLPLHVEMNSQAGLMWGMDVKRKDTLHSDLHIANQVCEYLQMLAVEVQEKRMTEKDASEEIKRTLLPLFVQYLKPKADPYLRSDFKEKTRNLAVGESSMGVIPNMVLRPRFGYMPTPVFGQVGMEGKGSDTLLKWSPLRGGVDALIHEALDLPEGKIKIVVFADNIYILSRHKLASMDGEKFEAQITKEDADEVVRLCKDWWGPSLHPNYSDYMESLWATTVTDAYSVFGATALKIDYLGSGQQGTGYLNTVHMLRVVHDCEEEFQASFEKTGGFDQFVSIAKGWGHYLTLENVLDLDELQNSEDGRVLRGDILGYDVTSFTLTEASETFKSSLYNGKRDEMTDWLLRHYNVEKNTIRFYLPVLQKERLLKSYLYSTKRRDDDDPLIEYKRFVSARALYALGGWLHPGSEALGIWNTRTFDEVSATVMDKEITNFISTWMQMTAEVQTEDVQAFESLLRSERANPSLFELISLAAGQQAADAWFFDLATRHDPEQLEEAALALLPTQAALKISGLNEAFTLEQLNQAMRSAQNTTDLKDVLQLLADLKEIKEGEAALPPLQTVEWNSDIARLRTRQVQKPEKLKKNERPTAGLSQSRASWAQMSKKSKVAEMSRVLTKLNELDNEGNILLKDPGFIMTVSVPTTELDDQIKDRNALAKNIWCARFGEKHGFNKNAVESALTRLSISSHRFELRSFRPS